MRRTRRDFLESEQTQQAVSPELRSLAQQYRAARSQQRRDVAGRVLQGAVMGAAGIPAPERAPQDSTALRGDLIAQLAEQRRSRSRTEAERMAGLADIAAAQEEGNTALLRALAQVESAAINSQGRIGAAQLARLTEETKGLQKAVLQTTLNAGEERRIREAAAAAAPFLRDQSDVDVARILSDVTAGLPPEKVGQAVGAFFGSGGLGQYTDEAPRDVSLRVQASVADDPVLGSVFERAVNSEAIPAAEVRRRVQQVADEAERIGVGSGGAVQRLREAAGLIPASRENSTDRITEAVLNPEALPPDDVEQMLMDELQSVGRAPANLAEFKTRLMATPAFDEFVQQAGYEDSPVGRQQAFKDVLAMQRMGKSESKRGQYQGYDREADEAKLGTSRGLDVDLRALPEAPPRPAAPAIAPTPAPQPAAASVVGGSQSSGQAAPAPQPEAAVERRAPVMPASELSAMQEASLAPIRAGQPQKNVQPKLDVSIDAYQRDRFGRPVSEEELVQMQGETGAVDAAIDAYQTGRFGRPMGEGELLRMGADRVERVLKAPNAPKAAESEQEPLDPYGESQTSTTKRRQRDLVAALLKRRVA